MRPTLIHAGILFILSMAAAAFSKPERAAHTDPGSAGRTDSSISAPGKKPTRAKPEKPAAPLAKPESGEDSKSEDTQEDEEAASDCDDCVLAWEAQVVVPPDLMAYIASRIPLPSTSQGTDSAALPAG
jgi:hypothetical protein